MLWAWRACIGANPIRSRLPMKRHHMLELIKRDRVACEVENWRTGSALDWKGVNRQQASELQQLAPIATMLAARV